MTNHFCVLIFCFLSIVVVAAALHVALQYNYVDVVDVLREFGASASWTDIDESGSDSSNESNFSNAPPSDTHHCTQCRALTRDYDWLLCLNCGHTFCRLCLLPDEVCYQCCDSRGTAEEEEEEEEDGYSSCGA